MALDEIVERIHADARSQAERVLSDAARQEEEILSAGKAEAAARTAASLERAAAELEAERNNRLSGVRMAARASVLGLKRDLIDEIFAQVEQDLALRPPEEYAAFLAALVPVEAARGSATVILGRDDLARNGERFPGLVAAELCRRLPVCEVTVRSEPGDFRAGINVHTRRSVYDISLETLLAERRDRWELAVARALFA